MECIRILLVFSAKAGCKRSFREHLKLLAFSFPRSSEFPSFLSTGRSKNQQQLFSLQLRFLSLHSTSSLWNSHFKSSWLLALYSKTEVSKCVQLFNIWRSGVLKVWNGLYFLFFPSLGFCFSPSAAFYLSSIHYFCLATSEFCWENWASHDQIKEVLASVLLLCTLSFSFEECCFFGRLLLETKMWCLNSQR